MYPRNRFAISRLGDQKHFQGKYQFKYRKNLVTGIVSFRSFGGNWTILPSDQEHLCAQQGDWERVRVISRLVDLGTLTMNGHVHFSCSL